MPADHDSSATPVRRKVLFSGRVQGVGFRFTTEAIASRFQVTGYVRNLPDGRVELIAEGTKTELDRFQTTIESTMQSYITEAAASDGTPTGEFTSFKMAF